MICFCFSCYYAVIIIRNKFFTHFIKFFNSQADVRNSIAFNLPTNVSHALLILINVLARNGCFSTNIYFKIPSLFYSLLDQDRLKQYYYLCQLLLCYCILMFLIMFFHLALITIKLKNLRLFLILITTINFTQTVIWIINNRLFILLFKIIIYNY